MSIGLPWRKNVKKQHSYVPLFLRMRLFQRNPSGWTIFQALYVGELIKLIKTFNIILISGEQVADIIIKDYYTVRLN